ncbi:Mambaquaretin-1 [Taenia solium]|eukprot:TsM_001125600 transcript=TsM_001125600 gene=TsM_001125600
MLALNADGILRGRPPPLLEDTAKFANDDSTGPMSVVKRPEKQINNYVELIKAASDYEALRNGGELHHLDSEADESNVQRSRGSRSMLLDNINHVYHLGHKHQHKGAPSIVYLDEDDEQRRILLKCTYGYHPGSGSGNFEMFYYSVKDKNCFPFTYTGIDGNSNRFNTYEECMQTCTTDLSTK